MKHFVTLAALLTSLSAFAQLPYNPDANNDGHIGAFDLTSLLSVYSGNFSNGVLGVGTEMLNLDIFPTAGGTGAFYRFADSAGVVTSWVVDLSLVPSSYPNFIDGFVKVQLDSVSNGTTLTIIKPSGWMTPLITCEGYVNGQFYHHEWTGFRFAPGFYTRMVFWNGEWLTNFAQDYYAE